MAEKAKKPEKPAKAGKAAEKAAPETPAKRANHIRRKEAREAEKLAARGKRFEATHRWARIAPEKVRWVARQIQGVPINRALEIIKFSKKRGGYLLGKVLKSALANAEYQISDQKLDLDLDSLHVVSAHAEEGPSMKRWMTRARGMAYPILRRFCHIYVTLAPAAGGDEGGAGAGTETAVGETKAKAKKKKAARAATAGAK
jgi:large subunit ribosomal protein L22